MAYDVVVISAFGRGHSLAVELRRQNLQVALLDVSFKLGSTSVEEQEGPFGYFAVEKAQVIDREELQQGDSLQICETGFSLWLKDGPFELKGPLFRHRAEKLALSEAILDKISNGGTCSSELIHLPFEKNWLLKLAYGFSATRYFHFSETNLGKDCIPLLSDLQIRWVTNNGFQKSINWVKDNQVEVIESADIKDISLNAKQSVESLEVRLGSSEKTLLVQGLQYLWCLTSEETGMFGERVQQSLFPFGFIEPDWTWVRYRFKMDPSFQRDQLPPHCLIIKDLALPWSHENFAVLQRTASAELFDVWIRMANIQRFNREYLQEQGALLLNLLLDKIPATNIVISVYPSGFESTYHQIGPSRFPVFSKNSLRMLRPRNLTNLQFHSPEQWPFLGWQGRLARQDELRRTIKSWWEKKLQRELKERNKTKVAADEGAMV